jgi:hypothetical protein
MFCAITQAAAAGGCSAQAKVSNARLAVCKHGVEDEDLVQKINAPLPRNGGGSRIPQWARGRVGN